MKEKVKECSNRPRRAQQAGRQEGAAEVGTWTDEWCLLLSPWAVEEEAAE